jgi:hypothetical protein
MEVALDNITIFNIPHHGRAVKLEDMVQLVDTNIKEVKSWEDHEDMAAYVYILKELRSQIDELFQSEEEL